MSEPLKGSLRLRLAIRFGVASLVLLAACAIYLFFRLDVIFQRDADSELRRTLAVVVQRLDEEVEPPDRELLEVEDRVLVRVTNQAGQVLIQSDGMTQSVPQDMFPAGTHQGVLTDRRNPSGDPIRFVVNAYRHGNVLVARDLRHELRLLRQFRKALILTVLLGASVAFLLGLTLARRGLQPLNAFAERAGAIGPENLHLRVEPGLVPSELIGLAGALNRTLARLEKAFTRVSALNADLAHELRTPLQALRLEMESLASLAGDGHRLDLEDRLGDMTANLDQVLALSEQMLFLAKAEDPATRIERVSLDPVPFIEEALAPFEALAVERGVSIRTHVDPKDRLFAEPILATRAVRNIVSNALRHSPSGSTLFVGLEKEGDNLVLRVSDEGPGMSPDLLSRIGQRFIRPDQARVHDVGGSGLGLAIVKGIMALHGGKLSLQSTPGLGTQAQLRFPLT